MVTVTVSNIERHMELGDIDERWINEQVNRRRHDGAVIWILVHIVANGLDLLLGSANCPRGGGGCRPLGAKKGISTRAKKGISTYIVADSDGKKTVDVGGIDVAEDLALDSQGRIILGGTSGQSSYYTRDFAIVRLTTGGALDTSFDNRRDQTPGHERQRPVTL